MEKLKLFFENLKARFDEIKPHFEKDKILTHITNHQRKIICTVVTIALVLIVWAGWCFYSKSQSEKYSAILHQALIDEQAGEIDKSTSALKGIYESSAPAGVRSIASLKYASQLLAAGKNDEATEAYLKINKTRSFDPYIREYAGLVALRTMISDNKDKDKITNLIADLEKHSKILKYHIIEQKGIFAWENGDFKTAGEAFKLLDKNPEVSEMLKKRAAEMVEIYNEKFPESSKDEILKPDTKSAEKASDAAKIKAKKE